MSSNRTLLVEGQTDKLAFESFFQELPDGRPEGLVVDTADMLRAPDRAGLGNREKIEEVSVLVALEPWAERFVGLVDRELREFDLDDMRDLISAHRVCDRLVWTRGHSFENYFFDLRIWWSAIKACAMTPSFGQAFTLFSEVHDSALAVAAALTVAAHELGRIDLIVGSVGLRTLRLEDRRMELAIPTWKLSMAGRGCDPEFIDAAASRFAQLLPRVAAADPEFLRWLAHGHIGLKVLWTAYLACLNETGGQDECNKANHTGTESRVAALCDGWSRLLCGGDCAAPVDALSMLGCALPAAAA